MRSAIVLLLLTTLSTATFGGQHAQDEIDMDFFIEKLTQFSGGKSVIIDGVESTITERGGIAGLDLARKFLKQEYEKLGFTYREQHFDTGTNVILEKPGTEKGRVLIISSHIDSVRNAGANDNGSGTIGNLAIARMLADVKHKHTLRILGFDREEQGLWGSRAYVNTVDKDEIIGVINFEMFATNSRDDGGFHVIDCNRPESTFLSDTFMETVNENDIDLTRVPACTGRSDHASFWAKNIPAVVISENFFGGDSDPCYHRSCDIVDDRMNFRYMQNILNATALTVHKLLNREFSSNVSLP